MKNNKIAINRTVTFFHPLTKALNTLFVLIKHLNFIFLIFLIISIIKFAQSATECLRNT